VKLGKRMTAIAAMVPKSRCVADIGTDHAYLPVYLVAEGIAESAIAGDVHKGPYLSAVNTACGSGVGEKISVRLGDGLAVVCPGEADTAVIAGMGGTTIAGILAARPEVTTSFRRLVLQPMSGAGFLRRWLADNGWCIDDETLVVEDGILYEVIAAEPGSAPGYEFLMDEIGPVLWEKRHPLLKTHLTIMLERLNQVIVKMRLSTQAVNSPKYREYQKKVDQLEEKLTCL